MVSTNTEVAFFAGGCFWCTEAVFQRVNGVLDVVPGYIGGEIKNPAYREICTGRTGHAEAVKITYDPTLVDFRELLTAFFATHDPTTLNKQGNDVGTQYRSEIFYTNLQQKQTTDDFIVMLGSEYVFDNAIVTAVSEASEFYVAGEDHHDFYNQHRNQPYCQIIIDPKLKKLASISNLKLN